MSGKASSTSTLRQRIQIVGYSAGAGIAGKVMQFFGLTYLALLVTPDSYGLFAILQIIIMGVSSIASSSFAFAANKSAAHLANMSVDLNFTSILTIIFRGKCPLFIFIIFINSVLVPILFTILAGGRFTPWLILLGAMSSVLVFTDMIVGSLAGFGSYKKTALIEGARGAFSGVMVVLLGSAFGYVGAVFGLFALDFVIVTIAAVVVIVHGRDKNIEGLRTGEHKAIVLSGLTSNSLAQVGNWLLVWLIQTSFGLSGVAVYAVANRFATLVLLAPAYLSKNMLGQMHRGNVLGNARESRRLIQFYVTTVTALGLSASVIAYAVLQFGFTDLTAKFNDLKIVLIVLLVATVLRAIATSLGIVCVARNLLRTWVLSDAIALLIFSLACVTFAVVLQLNLPWVLVGLALSNLTCLAFRLFALAYNVREEGKAVVTVAT
jgi:O-antigen/teichoic acid export membrane protein